MIPTTINGIPTHPLLVHFVVVLVPLTAVLTGMAAWLPNVARRLGWTVPALAVVTLLSIPVTTNAGEWLERRVNPTPLVGAHTAIADDLLPWSIAVAVLAIVVWALRSPWAMRKLGIGGVRTAAHAQAPSGRVTEPTGSGAVGTVTKTAAAPVEAPVRQPGWLRPVTLVVAALITVAAVGSVVEVYLIGESGAKAVWQGQFDPNAHPKQHRVGG